MDRRFFIALLRIDAPQRAQRSRRRMLSVFSVLRVSFLAAREEKQILRFAKDDMPF